MANGTIRIYKDDYDSLPLENKTISVAMPDGTVKKMPGLNVKGAKDYSFDDLVLVDNTESKSRRISAKRIKVCEGCGEISIINAKNLCKNCYCTMVRDKKNNVDRETIKEKRRQRIERRQKESELKKLYKQYPFNLLIDTFGAGITSELGESFERFDDRRSKVLDAFLESLRAKDRDLIKLKYEDDVPVNDIAETYSITKTAVYWLLKNIRMKLLANKEAIISGEVDKLVKFKNTDISKDPVDNSDDLPDEIKSAVDKYNAKYDDVIKTSGFEYMTKNNKDFYSLFTKKTADLLLVAGISSIDELRKTNFDTLSNIKGLGLQGMTEIEFVLNSQNK